MLVVGWNDSLQTTQIAWLDLAGKCRTNLAGAPCARETGDEAGKVRRLGYGAGKVAPIGECYQMRLNCAYLFEQLEWIQSAGHFPKPDFGGLGKALRLQQPLTRGLRRMVSLGDLSALAVLLRKLE